jgi:hypothetical protein
MIFTTHKWFRKTVCIYSYTYKSLAYDKIIAIFQPNWGVFRFFSMIHSALTVVSLSNKEDEGMK